ncbi:MAG TPA: FkbM family methyltransferase, partial [Pyrinomonadaceae bacterium]|nr:FkbM family methyltransferase [Pyrinomonadaceae bacterium]
MHVHSDAQEKQLDVAICHEVQIADCYRVRELAAAGFEPEIILDIGAHIGSFTVMAAKCFPRARIYSFEPLRQHYDVLVRNSRAGNCQPENSAVVGFFRAEEGHDIYVSSQLERAYRSRQLRNAISVEEMFRSLKLPRIDFLKIDCEQSEVNIFRELDFLDRIKDISVISGEWHYDTAKNEIRSTVGKTHDVDLIDEGFCNHF